MKLKLTREQIESNLDSGLVMALMNSGRHWQLRRNGQTKLWKTRPTHFQIPVKAGLKSCGYITHTSTFDTAKDAGADFVVNAREF